MWVTWKNVALALLVASLCVSADNESLPDTCERGLWGGLLEEWALTAPEHSGRQGRVMSLPPTKGYYVSDRMDAQLTPPPPPHHYSHAAPAQAGYAQYDEWQASPPPPPSGGKIVNKPPNPYKDKFRPSYPPPSPQQHIPLQQQQWADRLDAPPATPQKQVSETDLYLLSAIEKLVYRVDLMEKRLRKMEETMHYLVVGKETKPEPCAGNFTRVGGGCYWFSPEAGDWKAASLRCRKMRTHLLELDTDHEKRALLSALLADAKHKGLDFWTGGLNPGLLWIWAHSARPVLNNATISNATSGATTTSTSTSAATVVGDGRCLALVHDPALARYVYRGQDCSLRHRYICELPEEKIKEKLSNEVERAARELRTVGGGLRAAKIMWTRGPGAQA